MADDSTPPSSPKGGKSPSTPPENTHVPSRRGTSTSPPLNLSTSKSEPSAALSPGLKRRVISGIFSATSKDREPLLDRSRNESNRELANAKSTTSIPTPPPPPETREDKKPPKKARANCVEFEVKLHSSDKMLDPLSDLLTIPPNDVIIETIPRTFRTIEPTVPKDINTKEMTPHVRDCLDYFVRDWKVVKRNHRELHGGQTVPDVSKYPTADVMEEMVFNEETDKLIFSAVKGGDFHLDERLLGDYNMDVKKLNDKDRQINRFPLLGLLPLAKDQLRPSDTRILYSPPVTPRGQPIHVICKELKFTFGEVEPFFCYLSLLDVKKKRRISETFCFTLNSPAIWAMLDKCPVEPFTTAGCIQSLFFVSNPGPDVFLVLRVEKVLQGEFEASTDPYFKAQMKPKEREKYLAEVGNACKRLGKFTQPFGVGLLPLFDESGKPLLGAAGDQPITIPLVRMNGGDHSDQHICQTLPKFINEKERQRLKVYPGTCTLSINCKPPETLAGRLTPSLKAIKPAASDPKAPVIREVEEFHDVDTNLVPQTEFVHHLYIQPQVLNFASYSGSSSARNLIMEIKLAVTDDPKTDGLKVFYGRSNEPQFVSSVTTSVIYHNKKPSLCDEFKIALPFFPTPQHHLIFIVSHVICAAKKKKKDEVVTTPIAFAWLPLLKNGKFLEDEEHQVLAYHPVTSGYFSPEVLDGLKVADKNKKASILVKTKLVSTIYSLDNSIHTFFTFYDRRNLDETAFQNAFTAVMELKTVKPQPAAQFLPVLLRELFDVICNEPMGASRAAFFSLVTIAKTITNLSETKEVRSPLLEQYVQYAFENSFDKKNILPERLIMNLNVLMTEKASEGSFIEDLCRYSWFYFDVVVKTITLTWKDRGVLGEVLPRLGLMTETFDREIVSLIDGTIKEMYKLLDHETGREDVRALEVTGEWNRNLAMFFKDLLSIIDRGNVFNWINRYLEDLVNTLVPNPPLALLQCEFLRIVTDFEHYIPLNLPGISIAEEKIELISFWEKHYLCGLLLNEINGIFFKFTTKDCSDVRFRAVEVLYNLLLKHDLDSRYQAPERKERIASLYFPFITITIEAQIVHNILFISEPEERMMILLCFLYLVRHCPRKQLREWWKKETQKRITYFFVILAKALDCFEYGNILYTPDTGRSRELEQQLAFRPDDLMGVKTQDNRNVINTMEGTLSMKKNKKKKTAISTGSGNRLTQHLSREVGFICLDALTDFMQDFSAELNTKTSHYMESVVVNILLLMLKKNQCEAVVSSVFAALRHLIFCFPKQLFKYSNNFCGDIAYEVLRYSNSHSAVNRSKAAATLYLLLKHNFLTMRSITRMKLQATIAVSKLVGAGLTKNPSGIRQVLDAVLQYSENDKQPSNFTSPVKELITRLHNALASSAALYTNAYDPEMTADLYYTISLGYYDSPDLRLVWFTNLAKFHTAEKNYEEAAVCNLHLTALVLSYINIIKPAEAIQLEPVLFARAAPNIACDLITPSEMEEGICQTAAFTRQGVLNVLVEAVSLLKEHELYESAVDVQRLLVTIHQKNRNFGELSKVFQDLQAISEKVVSSNLSNSRLFACYYRVAFFGQLFGQMDGKQYIYKEQLGVRLADISERLTKQYKEKFGADNIVQLGNNIDLTQLDTEKKGYIQIVYVEPYFGTLEEQQKRSSPWDRRFNLDRFMFETPFTASGKAHGDTVDQFKRKTILSTEKPFPFVVKRLLVVNKEEVVLSPIENATEVIVNRNRASKLELAAIPPNSKTLQIVLQGSVLPQVNAGPLEFAKVFLGHKDSYPAPQVKALELALQEFVVYCHALLQLNKQVIKADQIAFQQTMEESYEKLLQDLSEFFPLPNPNDPEWHKLIPAQLQNSL